ncbi:MAG: hypothetical protein ACFBSE_01750 [Prochloraceae cyanobacterium]
MYITILDYEHLNGILKKNRKKNPTWEDIRDEIIQLKGDNWSSVYLRKEENDEFLEFMGIRRFKDNLYECIIYTQDSNELEWELYDPSKLSAESDLTRCVALNQVLKAAETYAKFGKRDPLLNWRDYNQNLDEESESELNEGFDEDEDF